MAFTLKAWNGVTLSGLLQQAQAALDLSDATGSASDWRVSLHGDAVTTLDKNASQAYTAGSFSELASANDYVQGGAGVANRDKLGITTVTLATGTLSWKCTPTAQIWGNTLPVTWAAGSTTAPNGCLVWANAVTSNTVTGAKPVALYIPFGAGSTGVPVTASTFTLTWSPTSTLATLTYPDG
jgi:hypothetical protein